MPFCGTKKKSEMEVAAGVGLQAKRADIILHVRIPLLASWDQPASRSTATAGLQQSAHKFLDKNDGLISWQRKRFPLN